MEGLRGLSIDLWFTLIYDDIDNYRIFIDTRAAAIHSVVNVYREDVSLEDIHKILEEVRPFMMDTHPYKVLDMIRAALGIDSEALDDMYRRYVDSVEVVNPNVNEDVLDVLDWALDKGVPIVLTTNTTYTEDMVWRLLRNKGLDRYFNSVVSSAEIEAGKPDKRIFREAADRLGLKPSEMIHIGDKYIHDAVGSYLAGMRPILYRGLWDKYGSFMGYGEGYSPTRYPPYIYVADSSREILKVFSSLLQE